MVSSVCAERGLMMRQSGGLGAAGMLQWPLIGRREELAAVEQSLTSSVSRAVVLAGAPGVGKTRLAREALELCEARDCVVRWAAATRAASSIPFGAVPHLLPHLGDTAPDQAELLRRAADGLIAEAGGRRLLVGIGDAHLLDDSSAALVHQLATATPVTVLVTVRSETHAPDPIVALWKDTVADRFEVQALSHADVEALAGVALGGQVDGSTVQTLWRLTQGNPLYLRELILGGLDSGNLTCVAGVWRWDGAIVTSPRLMELIEARLGRMHTAVLELLELVALAEPIGAQLPETLAKPEVLTAADRKGLLTTDGAGRRVQVRLAHPLYAEAIRARVSALRARAVYRQLAEAVEAAGARRLDDRLRVATWRLETGVAGSTPGQLTSAARLATGIFDFRLAERLDKCQRSQPQRRDVDQPPCAFGDERQDPAPVAEQDGRGPQRAARRQRRQRCGRVVLEGVSRVRDDRRDEGEQEAEPRHLGHRYAPPPSCPVCARMLPPCRWKPPSGQGHTARSFPRADRQAAEVATLLAEGHAGHDRRSCRQYRIPGLIRQYRRGPADHRRRREGASHHRRAAGAGHRARLPQPIATSTYRCQQR